MLYVTVHAPDTDFAGIDCLDGAIRKPDDQCPFAVDVHGGTVADGAVGFDHADFLADGHAIPAVLDKDFLPVGKEMAEQGIK